MSSRGAVLLVANYASDVGYAWWLMENYWACAAHAAAAQGRACHLIYPELRALPAVIRDAPLQAHQITMDEANPGANTELDALITRERIESVYLTDRAYLSRYYRRMRALGVRTIMMHDHTPGERPAVGGVKGWFKSALFRSGVLSCDWYVATTEYIRQRMITNVRIDPRTTLVVPNGIRALPAAPEDRDWARATLGVAPDDVVVGLVARAHRIKGIDFAIQCAQANSRDLPGVPIRYVFIGDGPDLAELQAQAAAAGLDERFRFLGRRDDARRLMRGFDIGFHPSRGEVGYCLAILEMMDAELPVLVPDLTSVNGATIDGSTGFVYPPEDLQAATAIIGRLAGSADLRRAIGARARQEVAARYVLDRTNEVFTREVAARL